MNTRRRTPTLLYAAAPSLWVRAAIKTVERELQLVSQPLLQPARQLARRPALTQQWRRPR
jgi:hypothetical protein